jgi:nucleotide-binding universal stress UspA family protein
MKTTTYHMLTSKKILTAIDLTPQNKTIIAYSAWLSRLLGSEIQLLYVIDYALTPPAYMTPYIEQEKKRDEDILLGFEKILLSAGIKAYHTIAFGRLVEAFLKAFADSKADMLIIGHKSHLIRQSSSERLIKSINKPMLIVRGKKSEQASLNSLTVKNILCPIDFSDNSRKAFEAAQNIAELCGAKLTAAHIVSEIKIQKCLTALQTLEEKDKSTFRQDCLCSAEQELSAFLKDTPGIEGITANGITYEEINSLAEKTNADLIVMGARGLSYIEGLMLGSVSEAVIKSSPCPVMIIR